MNVLYFGQYLRIYLPTIIFLTYKNKCQVLRANLLDRSTLKYHVDVSTQATIPAIKQVIKRLSNVNVYKIQDYTPWIIYVGNING